MDTAPDIITAHDTDSIYETLDGRRSAWAKAGHVTAQINQSGSGDAQIPTNNGSPANVDAADPTYDHLCRFNNRASRTMLEGSTGKRSTDPVVSVRPKPQPKPRAAYSADGPHRGRGREDELIPSSEGATANRATVFGTCESRSPLRVGPCPSELVSSSLTELARQSSSGGKRIVCQLTMVGVVENGKPVPVQQRPTSNALFLLEPSRDCGEVGEEAFQCPNAKFRIMRNEASRDSGNDVACEASAGAGVIGTKGSEYFTLQPLDQEDDLSDLIDTFPSPPPLDGEERKARAADLRGSLHLGNRCSLHGQCSVSSFPGLSEDREEDRCQPQSFRKSRIHSCPDTESADNSPTLPLKNPGYKRSLSSPHSSKENRRHSDASPPMGNKLDAESLKARIQKEMRALGFLSDTDSRDQDQEEAVAGTESESATDDTQGLDHGRSDIRAPRNEYFILEPEADSDEDEDSRDSTEGLSKIPLATNVSGLASRSVSVTDTPGRSRHNCQHSQGLPPDLPQRNRRKIYHIRSKSETPFYRPIHSRHRREGDEEEEEEGPVVVSLKKNTDTVVSSGILSGAGENREPLAPSVKSQSGIVSERRDKE